MDTVEPVNKAKLHFKFIYLIVALISIVTILFVYYALTAHAGSPASIGTVSPGDNVSVYYTGYLTNGTVFGSNVGQNPLNFVVGSSHIITGFNNAVIGMSLGETKNITLPPSEAYGDVNKSLIITVPISVFQNQTVYLGETVGNAYQQGRIISLNRTNATINFNPPLAGDTLVFSIKVVGIKG